MGKKNVMQNVAKHLARGSKSSVEKGLLLHAKFFAALGMTFDDARLPGLAPQTE